MAAEPPADLISVMLNDKGLERFHAGEKALELLLPMAEQDELLRDGFECVAQHELKKNDRELWFMFHYEDRELMFSIDLRQMTYWTTLNRTPIPFTQLDELRPRIQEVIRALKPGANVTAVSEWVRLFGYFRPLSPFDGKEFTADKFPLEPANQLQPVEAFCLGDIRNDRVIGAYDGIRSLANQHKKLANLRSLGEYMYRQWIDEQAFLNDGGVFFSGPLTDFDGGQTECVMTFGQDRLGPYFTFNHVGNTFGLDHKWLVTEL